MLEFLLIAVGAGGLGWWLYKRWKGKQGLADSSLLDALDERIKGYREPEDLKSMPVFEQMIHVIRQQASSLSRCAIFRDESRRLWQISEESDQPLMVLVMGEFSTGKSTFINTLLGADVLTTAQIPTTAVISLLSYGETPAVKLHHQDGSVTDYDFTRLGEITAEGDADKQALRDKLDYVEIRYPNEMLKKIHIVDTPGLNAHREKHTEKTVNFQDKADVVLWMFKADASGRSTELSAIKALGKRLKPIAIVNCIDNVLESDDYEEDEDPVEETLTRFRRRVGDSVQDVIGISSLLARQALAAGDAKALEACGWTGFRKKLDDVLVNRSAELKIRSVKEKLAEFIAQMSQVFQQYDKKHKENAKYFQSQESAEQEIQEEIENLEKVKQRLLSGMEEAASCRQEYQNTYADRGMESIDDTAQLMDLAAKLGSQANCVVPLLEILPDDERWGSSIQDIQLMQDEQERILRGFDRWFSHYYQICDRVDDLEREEDHVGELREDYENSGLFGGTPIFDFSGRRDRLNSAVESYNTHLEKLKRDVAVHWQKYKSTCKSAISVNVDIAALEKKICRLVDDELVYEQERLVRTKNDFHLEQQRYETEKTELDQGRQAVEVLKHTAASLEG